MNCKSKRWFTLFLFISSIAHNAPLDEIQCISRRNSSKNRFQSCGSTILNSAHETQRLTKDADNDNSVLSMPLAHF